MKKDEAHPDLQVFPALALGIMTIASAPSPELKKLVENLDADEIVRAHAIVALGKLGDKSSVAWLVEGRTDGQEHPRPEVVGDRARPPDRQGGREDRRDAHDAREERV